MKSNQGKSRKQSKGEDESHPAAFLGGGAAGAVAGATAGSLAGPIGTIAGAAIGGLAGAKAGESLAEMPEEDDVYWKEHFESRPYAQEGKTYQDYRPAYNAGYGAYCEYGEQGKSFDEVESHIKQRYEGSKDKTFEWNDAREAARDAFNRSLQLREERLRAEKDRFQTGDVTLRKEVVSEDRTIEVPVEREEVIVERRPASGSVEGGEIRENPEEIARVQVSEEKVRLEKDVVPTEEVSLSKRTVQDKQQVRGTVKREEARVEKQGDINVEDDNERKNKGSDSFRDSHHRI